MLRAHLSGLLCIALVAGCDSRALEPQEISAVRACIRTVACELKSYPKIENCLDDLRVRMSPAMSAVQVEIFHCVNSSRSCTEVKECTGSKGECDQSHEATCLDEVATSCDLVTHQFVQYDCAAVGATCAVDEQYSFSATCEGDPSLAEFKNTFVDRCDDGACEDQGACEEDTWITCDGDRLVVCLENRKVSYDCAALALGPCQTTSNGWGRCSPPEEAAD